MNKKSSNTTKSDSALKTFNSLDALRSEALNMAHQGFVFINEGEYADFAAFATEYDGARVLGYAKAINLDVYLLAVGTFLAVPTCTIIKDNKFIV